MSAFLVWNARGVGNATTTRHLKLIYRKYNIAFLAILEPMLPFNKASHFARKLGLPQVFSNDSEGGKVWLCLPGNHSFTVLGATDQFLAVTLDWKGVSVVLVVINANAIIC